MRSFSYIVKPVRMAELADAVKQVIYTGGNGDPPPGNQETLRVSPVPIVLPGGLANEIEKADGSAATGG